MTAAANLLEAHPAVERPGRMPAKSPVPKPPPPPHVGGHAVSVAADDFERGCLLVEVLKKQGFRATFDGHRSEALLAAEEQANTILVLDVSPGDKTAITWLEELRSSRSRAELPLVLVSPSNDVDEILGAMRAGADDVVPASGGLVALVDRVIQLAVERSRDDRMIGPFRVRQRIGCGAMGSIFVGERAVDGQKVALKLLPPSMGRDPDAVKRFSQESKFISKVKHRCLARWVDSGRSGENHYIAMELVEGSNLADESTRAPLMTSAALLATKDVAAGLGALHKQGIIHRDVKPANVMVTKAGGAKLIDLGVAKDTNADHRLTQSGMSVGSFVYAAPEQLAGKPSVSADIYSLGCTLFHALTGQPPFEPTTPIAALLDAKYSKPPLVSSLNPGVPRAVDTFVAKLMSPKPQRRPRSCAEVERVLDELLSIRHWHEGYTARRIGTLGLAVAVGLGSMALAAGYLLSVGYF